MSMREVMVVSGARTAIGGYGGSLKDTPPTKLGAIAIKEAVIADRVGWLGQDPIDAAFRLERHEFRGQNYLQAKLVGLAPADQGAGRSSSSKAA